MSKKSIIGLALAAVLISGPFIGARAGNVSAACWEGFCPAGGDDTDQATARDMDKAQRDTDKAKRDMDKPDTTSRDPYLFTPTLP